LLGIYGEQYLLKIFSWQNYHLTILDYMWEGHVVLIYLLLGLLL